MAMLAKPSGRLPLVAAFLGCLVLFSARARAVSRDEAEVEIKIGRHRSREPAPHFEVSLGEKRCPTQVTEASPCQLTLPAGTMTLNATGTAHLQQDVRIGPGPMNVVLDEDTVGDAPAYVFLGSIMVAVF